MCGSWQPRHIGPNYEAKQNRENFRSGTTAIFLWHFWGNAQPPEDCNSYFHSEPHCPVSTQRFSPLNGSNAQPPPSPYYFCCVWGFRTHQEFVNKVVWRRVVPYSTGCLQLVRNHQENDILVWLVRKYFPLHAGAKIKVAVVLSRMCS